MKVKLQTNQRAATARRGAIALFVTSDEREISWLGFVAGFFKGLLPFARPTLATFSLPETNLV